MKAILTYKDLVEEEIVDNRLTLKEKKFDEYEEFSDFTVCWRGNIYAFNAKDIRSLIWGIYVKNQGYSKEVSIAFQDPESPWHGLVWYYVSTLNIEEIIRSGTGKMSFRRKFPEDVNARQWNHFCIQSSLKKMMVSWIYNGMIFANVSQPDVWDNSDNFITTEMFEPWFDNKTHSRGIYLHRNLGEADFLASGMITDLQFWKRALSLQEMYDITTCKTFPEGDLLAWNADDYVVYNTSLPYQYEVVEIESDGLCSRSSNYEYFPGKAASFDGAFHLCKRFGGSLIMTRTAEDYEKAFDFLNRKLLTDKLQKRKAGSKFIGAVRRMYSNTAYTPKTSDSMLGEPISTKHGVTQGKKSSANLYSFFVSDMGECLSEFDEDFMDPLNLCQLADDTAAFATTLETIGPKLKALFVYSKENHQSANIGKTKYLHLSKTPLTDPIEIAEGQFVESAHKEGYRYLGVLFICSDEIAEQILKNIEDRKGNMYKFYAWLENNQDTPIKVKLLVLYNCVFSSIFYCAETWFELDAVSDVMLLLERQALKRCLGVKASTPDDILYTELDRPDIVSSTKERQYKFFCKLANLDGSAIVCDILDMCAAADLDVIRYYNSLTDSHCEKDITERKERLNTAETTYIKRYREITNLEYCHPIYESYLREDIRIILTRWRLSCIPLLIETGRYKGIERKDRLCLFCNVVEDEDHAIFSCEAYDSLRIGREQVLSNRSLKEILCPKDKDIAYTVGCFLKDIEDRRKSLLGI